MTCRPIRALVRRKNVKLPTPKDSTFSHLCLWKSPNRSRGRVYACCANLKGRLDLKESSALQIMIVRHIRASLRLKNSKTALFCKNFGHRLDAHICVFCNIFRFRDLIYLVLWVGWWYKKIGHTASSSSITHPKSFNTRQKIRVKTKWKRHPPQEPNLGIPYFISRCQHFEVFSWYFVFW